MTRGRRKQKQVLNIVLALVAVALVAIVLITQKNLGTNQREARGDHLLVDYREMQVTDINIQAKGEPAVVLAKTGDEWRITAPSPDEADGNAVEDYLTHLQFAAWERRIPETPEAGVDYGFESPRLTVDLTMGDVKYELTLGKTSVAPPGSVYAQVSGQNVTQPGVGIISGQLAERLAASADSFRPTWLLPYLSTALASIQIDGAGGSRELVRHTDDRWYLKIGDEEVRAARRPVEFMLSQFARLEAERFLPMDAATAVQEAAPTVTITMVPKRAGAQRGVTVVGGACPGEAGSVVAIRKEPNPIAACVPSDVLRGLEQPASALVDQHLFALRPDQVQEWTLSRASEVLELARKDAGWVARKPLEAPVEAEVGNQRLAAILDARGERLEGPDLAAIGLEKPLGKVVLRAVALDDDGVTEVVTFSAPDRLGRVHVLRESDGVVLRLPKGGAIALNAGVAFVRARQVTDLPDTDVTQIVVEGPRGLVRVAMGEGGEMELVEPEGFAADPGMLTDWTRMLAGLVADRWVADKDDGSYGLAKPQLTVRFLEEPVKGPRKWHELRVGRRTRGGAFAAYDGQQGVFVLPRAALSAFERVPSDRDVFAFDPQQVAAIDISARSLDLHLTRSGDQWVLTTPVAGLNADRVNEIATGLSQLRAEGTVHVGKARPEEGFESPLMTVRVTRIPGAGPPLVYRVGAGDVWDDASIYYARIDGQNATFALPRAPVRRILDTL